MSSITVPPAKMPYLNRPSRSSAELPRSFDDFLEEAYQSSSFVLKIPYFLAFLSLGIANSGDATEISCMNYLLSYAPFQAEILNYNLSTNGATLNATIFIGMLLGGLLTGAIGDNVGRKRVAVAGMAVNATSGILSAFSPNVYALAICRFFSGIGIGAILSSLVTFATEISPPSKRGFYVTFVASFWTVGSITVSIFALILLGKYQGSWRIFLLGCAVPSMVGCVMVGLLVPESPRFFASHGRYEEALLSVNWFADSMGYKGAELTLDEVTHHFSYCQSENLRDEASKRLIRKESFYQAFTNIAALYERGTRKNTIQLQYVWFCMSFGSGLCGWINTLFTKIHVQNVYFVALLFALANIPGNVTSALLLDKVGRKQMLIWSMLLTSAALFAFAHAASDVSINSAFVVLSACLFHACLVSGWCTINCMTGESFPTRVRSTGMGVCAASGRIATVLVQYVNGALIDQPALLLLVSSLVILTGASSPLLMRMKEMSRLPLTDRSPSEIARAVGEEMAEASRKPDVPTRNILQGVDTSPHVKGQPFIAGAAAAEVL
jgi:MFS family permease